MTTRDDDVVGQAERLHGMGLATHWLWPKSKVPVKEGWASGKRLEWAEVKEGFRPGFNLGVRLGTPSKIDGMYLAYIDCDCKSSEPRHRQEMLDALEKFFPGLAAAPTARVATGRGNGSMHILVLTKSPAAGICLAKSKDFVKVKMPSVKPSKRERETLTAEDLTAGWRIRAAWEVGTMGEGRQAVLPPSTHPDTGDVYYWLITPEDGPLPILELPSALPAAPKLRLVKPGDFVPVPGVNLERLSPSILDLIREGAPDRSAALLPVCAAMVKAGYTDPEILTVLTDQEYALGEAAYDHAKTEDRVRAAAWVERFTLKKARAENDPRFTFSVIEPTLEEELGLAAAPSILPGEDAWDANLKREKGDGTALKPTRVNVVATLVNVIGPGIFKYDLLAGSILHGQNTPWARVETSVTNDNLARMLVWLSTARRMEVPENILLNSITEIARRNEFHPVRDYLNPLVWDGKPRLTTWLSAYCKAEGPEPYLSEISVKTLAAAVKRAYEPGAKYHQVLILEGAQGVRKSTAIEILGGKWYSNARIAPEGHNLKDTVLNMQGVWIHELGELSTLKYADAETMKDFISTAADKIRVPFSRLPEVFARQSIFIGSTNGDTYLKDRTGNRRIWPVKTAGLIDTDALRADRDQLWAEAKWCYELGETLELSREAEAQATEEQDARTAGDETLEEIMIDAIAEARLAGPNQWKFNPDEISIRALYHPIGGVIPKHQISKSDEFQMADCLRKLNYCPGRPQGGVNRKRVWRLKTKK